MEPMLFPDELPILLNFAIELPENSKIIEWGSGGSTVAFTRSIRPDQKIVSIEHDKVWYDSVLETLASDLSKNFIYYYKPDNGIIPSRTPNSIEAELPCGFDEYILPDESILDADMFFIDGMCRCTIALMLLAKAKNRNAIILIHDYLRRPTYYNWILRLFPRFERVGTSLLRLYMT